MRSVVPFHEFHVKLSDGRIFRHEQKLRLGDKGGTTRLACSENSEYDEALKRKVLRPTQWSQN